VLADLQGAPKAPQEPLPETTVPERVVRDEQAMALDGMVKRLRAYVAELQDEIRERDQRIEQLNQGLRRARSATERRLRRDAEIATKDAIIENLRQQLKNQKRHTRKLKKRLDRLRTVANIELTEDYTPLKVLDSLTREGMRSLEEGIGIEAGDVLYVPRINGWGRGVVRDLAGKGVWALIVGRDGPEDLDPQLVGAFRDADLPLIPDNAVGADIKGKTGAARTAAIESAVRDWEESQKEYRREKEAERLEYLFKEYRSEREKEVRRGG
jgi:uncharacterized protein